MKQYNEKKWYNENFDTEEPLEGHELRFLQKLEKSKSGPKKGKLIALKKLLPITGIAASFLFIFLMAGKFSDMKNHSGELASISPEMAKTEGFYSGIIQREFAKLSEEKNPQTEKIINDAISQLEVLEKNHEKLKKDLVNSGNDKRVVYAMISNYQQRIDVLQNVLKKIDEINNLKNQIYENHIL
ncbi:MAG TPA: DUF4179 domain-containing protein [Salinimicrobium sp.]|nr:DUF4179 domain-containing protein [Salinimicrobium sp.]